MFNVESEISDLQGRPHIALIDFDGLDSHVDEILGNINRMKEEAAGTTKEE